MSRAWAGPWTARFHNGPHRGTERHWAVGPVWEELRLAPLPHRRQWFISGGDGIPTPTGPAVVEPWPGEVRYVLRSTKHHHVDKQLVLIALYEQEDAPVPAR
jgi:hypothetical protein